MRTASSGSCAVFSSLAFHLSQPQIADVLLLMPERQRSPVFGLPLTVCCLSDRSQRGGPGTDILHCLLQGARSHAVRRIEAAASKDVLLLGE